MLESCLRNLTSLPCSVPPRRTPKPTPPKCGNAWIKPASSPIVLGDDTPGVIEGSWEVRVAPADRERAEAIAAAPPPEPEDESEVSDRALTHDLDFVPVFRNQTHDAEMEAISIQSLLEANGIPCVLVGSSSFPSLPFEVRVPKSRLEEAKSLLEEIKQSAADSAE